MKSEKSMNIQNEIGGMNVYQAIDKVKQLTLIEQKAIDFIFNEIRLTVRPSSNINDIVFIYFLEHEIRRLELGYNDED